MQITHSNSLSSAPWVPRAAWRMAYAAPVSGQPPVLVLDVAGQNYGLGTTFRHLDTLSSCTRASAKCVVSEMGTLVDVPMDIIALDQRQGTRAISLEPGRANLLLHSTSLGQSPWSPTGATVLSDLGSAPDGGDMTTIRSNGPHSGDTAVVQNASVTPGEIYTISAYVRRDQHRYAQLFGFGNGGAGSAFDLISGVAQVNSNWQAAGIEILSVTHARIWGIVVPSANGTAFFGLASNLTGQKEFLGDEQLSFWGAQIEAGQMPSSLIHTAAATSSRAADTFSAGLGTRWPTGGAALYLDFEVLHAPTSQHLARFRSQDGGDVLILSADATGQAVARFTRSGAPLAEVTGAALTTGRNQIVVRADAAGVALAQSGAVVSATGACAFGPGACLELDSAGALPLAPLRLRKALVFGEGLSNADCLALSLGG